jgi:uncharacterized membrane protein YfcA
MPWQWPVGALCAFLLALLTTPAGVSGAVLLLPVQLSVLRVPTLVVTPTNLLFNVLATPGALLRFGLEGRLRNWLSGLLVAGTLPGVVLGAVIRVEWLSDSRSFMYVAAGVLFPLGLWLLLAGQRLALEPPPQTAGVKRAIWGLALLVGVVGGIYGIGGGSLLAPILIGWGFSVYEVAPATIMATLLTSIVGVGTFEGLQSVHHGSISPDWALGVFLGAGGFVGSYCGARIQSRIPERSLRKLLGLVACIVAARYAQSAATAERSAGVQVGHAST